MFTLDQILTSSRPRTRTPRTPWTTHNVGYGNLYKRVLLYPSHVYYTAGKIWKSFHLNCRRTPPGKISFLKSTLNPAMITRTIALKLIKRLHYCTNVDVVKPDLWLNLCTDISKKKYSMMGDCGDYTADFKTQLRTLDEQKRRRSKQQGIRSICLEKDVLNSCVRWRRCTFLSRGYHQCLMGGAGKASPMPLREEKKVR